MKKLKLLLLGGLFTLFGVFNFSNAQFLSEKDLSASELLYYKFDLSDSSNVSVKQIGGRVCMQVKYSTGENCNVSSCSFTHFGFSCDFSFSSNSLPSDATYVRFGQLDSAVNYILTTKSSKMPVATLTPVITGLTESINEFIPYVAYVGLGVLGVIIGFVAIKWLINRVRRQSFSVFSSRKRK